MRQGLAKFLIEKGEDCEEAQRWVSLLETPCHHPLLPWGTEFADEEASGSGGPTDIDAKCQEYFGTGDHVSSVGTYRKAD